ncbi:DDE-type integrase/transposase/recombinase [Altererythrobacter confluentis]|uniref:DDE-type integrase/transposase/recombinase n=1 Tax=Allopontixanthobacter confluentis TaxID=1849021 RepID=A0A6L7GDC4_9SPHN|nr:Mu transposase C-terminal domain-containing protein [Allopontixanthobacter confluentis]MXP13590.1 DDE-type integrase/transposase/recombinase [Allopontixanthobacter confluentis]
MFLPRDVFQFAIAKKAPRKGTRKLQFPLKQLPELGAIAVSKNVLARVLWVTKEQAYLINLSNPKIEIWIATQTELGELLFKCIIRRVPDYDISRTKPDDFASDAQIVRRDANLALITPFLTQSPNIFEKSYRTFAITCQAKKSGVGRKTIRKHLENYWRGGLTANALLPNFDKSGNPGQTKKRGKTPLGRRPAAGSPKAMVIDDKVKEFFEDMTNALYRGRARCSLASAHRHIVGAYLFEARRDPSTGDLLQFTEKQTANIPVPTLRQFRYWYKNSNRKVDDEKALLGPSRYNKDRRAKLGSATANLFGIGSRYEIDATPLDIGLLSTRSRLRYVGRPNLYIVIDTYSKMIVGMHVTFAPPSWQAATMAIRNLSENKVEFAARFGLEITPEDWPVCDVLPARILADRGELEGYQASTFVAKTGTTIENTAPYRGDMKGTVEKRFDLINSYLRQIAPGVVTSDHAEKGEVDYRKKAKLNLAELTKLIIKWIVHHNNYYVLEKVSQTSAMIDAGVKPIARDMWNWSMEMGLSELRKFPYAELEFSLLQSGDATVHNDGLHVQGLRYFSADLRAENRFEKGAGSSREKVCWDQQDTNQIWRLRRDGSREICNLIDEKYSNLSFAEAQKIKGANRIAAAHAKNASAEKLFEIALDAEVVTDDLSRIYWAEQSNASLKDAPGSRKIEAAEEREGQILNSGIPRNLAMRKDNSGSAQAGEA